MKFEMIGGQDVKKTLSAMVTRLGGVLDCGLPKSPKDNDYPWQEAEASGSRTHRHVLQDYAPFNVPIDLCCVESEFKVVNANPSVLRQSFYEHYWRSFPNIAKKVMSVFPRTHEYYHRSQGTEYGFVWQCVCDQLSVSCVGLMRHCPRPGGRLPCMARDTGGEINVSHAAGVIK